MPPNHLVCSNARSPPSSPLKVRKRRDNKSSQSDLNYAFTNGAPKANHFPSHVHAAAGKENVSSVLMDHQRILPPPSSSSRPSLNLPRVRLEDGISAGSMYERPSTAMGTLGGPLSDGPPALQRHQTVGKRVLSKVVGGFTNRTRSQQDIRQTEGNLLRRISGKGKRSAGDEAARSRSMDIPVSPSSTTSSFVTVSSLPPTSTTPAEIPRTAHKGHSISPVKTPWTVRKPTMAPSKPPVLSVPPSLLGVDLRVTPEVLLLDVAAEKSIWVAVEVEDSINTPLPATNLSTGLDVVVIVDNS
ncbi:hypothetical protein LTR16_005797, partial [Cryomyces antarcticus]